MDQHSIRFIPALRYRVLTPLYDVLLRLVMRDAVFKRRLVREANLTNGQRVLDLGCGTATLSVRIRRRYPGTDVVGLDADPQILEIARRNARRAGVDLTLVRGTATTLPYPEGSFDRVVSSLVFHHLAREAKRSTLREVFRVLKPGGQVHIADLGKPHTRLMWVISLVVRHAEQTADNIDGLLPVMLGAGGFTGVSESVHYSRPVGTIALYRGRKPG